MDILSSIAGCFGRTTLDNDLTNTREKLRISSTARSTQEISDKIIELLRTAEKNGPNLRYQISDAVGDQGWTEGIARAIVVGLELILKESREMIGPVLIELIGKSEDEANAVFAFPHEHPYLTAGFATIVAVGILVFIAPWAVEALGFSELGPVADSFAALWQSSYGGFVPKGSLFSFLQRLGMTWGRSTALSGIGDDSRN